MGKRADEPDFEWRQRGVSRKNIREIVSGRCVIAKPRARIVTDLSERTARRNQHCSSGDRVDRHKKLHDARWWCAVHGSSHSCSVRRDGPRHHQCFLKPFPAGKQNAALSTRCPPYQRRRRVESNARVRYVSTTMDNSDDHSELDNPLTAPVTSAPETQADPNGAATAATSAMPAVHRERKQKFYRQHFFALTSRCETIQQVSPTVSDGSLRCALPEMVVSAVIASLPSGLPFVSIINFTGPLFLGQRTSRAQDTPNRQTVETCASWTKVCVRLCKAVTHSDNKYWCVFIFSDLSWIDWTSIRIIGGKWN